MPHLVARDVNPLPEWFAKAFKERATIGKIAGADDSSSGADATFEALRARQEAIDAKRKAQEEKIARGEKPEDVFEDPREKRLRELKEQEKQNEQGAGAEEKAAKQATPSSQRKGRSDSRRAPAVAAAPAPGFFFPDATFASHVEALHAALAGGEPVHLCGGQQRVAATNPARLRHAADAAGGGGQPAGSADRG